MQNELVGCKSLGNQFAVLGSSDYDVDSVFVHAVTPQTMLEETIELIQTTSVENNLEELGDLLKFSQCVLYDSDKMIQARDRSKEAGSESRGEDRERGSLN